MCQGSCPSRSLPVKALARQGPCPSTPSLVKVLAYVNVLPVKALRGCCPSRPLPVNVLAVTTLLVNTLHVNALINAFPVNTLARQRSCLSTCEGSCLSTPLPVLTSFLYQRPYLSTLSVSTPACHQSRPLPVSKSFRPPQRRCLCPYLSTLSLFINLLLS